MKRIMFVCHLKLLGYTDRKGDVADPWYSGRFYVAYRDIHEGCTAPTERICNDE